MAYNNTNMLRIAQIGAMNRPEFRNMPTLDFSGAVDNFFNAKDAAEQRELAEQKRTKMNAYADALKEQHPQDAARIEADPLAYAAMLDDNAKAERDQQFKMDVLKRQLGNSMALERMKNENAVGLAKLAAELKANTDSAFGSKNEFINLMGIKNNPKMWENLPEEDKKLIVARLNYMSNNPEVTYEKSYQGQRGKDTAKQEASSLQASIENEQQYGKVDNAINLVNSLPDSLFMPYTAALANAGALSYGNIGLSNENQQAYGELERTIGSLQNDLLQKARSKGQTGINTMSEIRQATKGLQYDRGKERLLGALKQLQNIEYKLDAMPSVVSVMPNNDVIDASEYFK